MKIGDKLKQRKVPFLSFEFFPPSDDAGFSSFYSVAEKLSAASPLFVSVTYGAGGAKQDRTLNVARHLAGMGLEVMSHLTCVNARPAGLLDYIMRLMDMGVENVLALRGDAPKTPGWKWDGPFRHAGDLVSYISHQVPQMGIGVAAYPCPHPESPSYELDRLHTKEKILAGADFAVTQLFFDSREYFELVSRLRSLGVDCPVIPGILPIQSLASLRRVISLCGVSIPAKLYIDLEEADRQGGEAAVRKVGMDFAINQITSLLVGGAPGIHLYTLNKADLCLELAKETGLARG